MTPRRTHTVSEAKPIVPWNPEEMGLANLQPSNRKNETEEPVQDYKRRRASYRAKMTHLTKRTTIQEHRDLINLRMRVLSEREGYRLLGPVERVTTKDTPKVIEKEQRQKR